MTDISFDFTGKNYLVTGASSGIGQQVALDLALSGANVLALARREEELKKLQSQYPDKITIAIADVCDKDIVKNVLRNFVDEKGLFNGFVHAAGIYAFSPIKVFDKNQFQKMMDTNFWSGFDIVQILSKKSFSETEASFVMFSSVSAVKGGKGLLAYSASKAAISSAVRSVAKEICPRKQRINTVMPGNVQTPMTEPYQNNEVDSRSLLGASHPVDISFPVLFLLSDGARYITGTDLLVDGGYLSN